MTTESNETQERSIDTLLNLSYSDMTESEIERVVEWKANAKAKSQANQAQLEAIKAAGQQLADDAKARHEEAKATQSEFLNLSLERLRQSTAALDDIEQTIESRKEEMANEQEEKQE